MLITKFLFASLILILFSCGKVENSSSTDRYIYSPSVTNRSPEFEAAVKILEKKCAQCHQEWLSMPENQFVTSGLIVGGDGLNSLLYGRNLRALGGPGIKNMPNDGSPALTLTELNALVGWINTVSP
jgi:hypothetical protein